MMKIAGSISQGHGSADPDPDPHQNVMDPGHWFLVTLSQKIYCQIGGESLIVIKKVFL